MFLRVLGSALFMILTLRPMRTFLSMMARSMTEFAPIPRRAVQPVVLGVLLAIFGEIDAHDVTYRGS